MGATLTGVALAPKLPSLRAITMVVGIDRLAVTGAHSFQLCFDYDGALGRQRVPYPEPDAPALYPEGGIL
jgi:hypothetical protein